MSLRKLVGMEGGVKDLQFEVKPRTILFEGVQRNTFFNLYLQKGMQIISKFESGFDHNIKDSIYRFRNPETKSFRVTSMDHSLYTWSIYKVSAANNQQQFLDSGSFDTKTAIQLYEMELEHKERQIQTSFIQKMINRSIILDLWLKAKHQMKTHRAILKCVFQEKQINLQFMFEIKNSLDLQITKKIEEQERKKNMKRSKSQSNIDYSPLPANPSDINVRPVNEPLTIVDQCVSPLLREAKKKHQLQTRPKSSITIQQVSTSKSAKDDIKIKTKSGKNVEETKIYHVQSNTNEGEGSKESEQNYFATVKVMNPKGDQILDQTVYDSRTLRPLRTQDSSSQPMKKFSLLSDIIQQSYQGSSSYGNLDKRSSNGFNNYYPQKADAALDDPQGHEEKTEPLNKFKTLQYQHHKTKLQVNQDFRRAQTAQKTHLDIDGQQPHEDSMLEQPSDIKTNETKDDSKKDIKIKSSGDPHAKWYILFALLVILGMLGGEWFLCCSDSAKKDSIKKRMKERKIK